MNIQWPSGIFYFKSILSDSNNLICIFVGWVALMFMGLELTESFGLVVSSLGNVGPGLGAYGPAFSWSALPDLAKWLLSFMMLIGRLELFGILLMFSPGFWHKR